MATEKQIAANRVNAAKGGPKTEAGKNRCRANALQHGLSCRTIVVMAGENEEEYKTLLSEFTASFNPQNAIEQSLVVRLANAHWRSQRKEGAEAGLLWWAVVQERHSIKTAGDAAGVDASHVPQERYIGLSFLRKNGAMERFLRYQAAIDREFHKTLDELFRIHKLRQTEPPAKPAAIPARPAHTDARASSGVRASHSTESTSAEIGTVLQSSEPGVTTSTDPAPLPPERGEISPAA